MSAAQHPDPLTAMLDIEMACRKYARGLPQRVNPESDWSGIAFRLGDNRLLAPLDEVVEILPCPELTVVPNTRSWVWGIANIRGKLLPVIDTGGFLHGPASPVTSRSRVLVVDHKGVFTGLLVDEVIGLKHLPAEQIVPARETLDAAMQPYVTQGSYLKDEYWGVFSLFALVEAPHFLQTAT